MATVLMWTFVYNILRPPESQYTNIFLPQTISHYSGFINEGPSQIDEDIHDKKVINVSMAKLNSNTLVASASTSNNFNQVPMEVNI